MSQCLVYQSPWWFPCRWRRLTHFWVSSPLQTRDSRGDKVSGIRISSLLTEMSNIAWIAVIRFLYLKTWGKDKGNSVMLTYVTFGYGHGGWSLCIVKCLTAQNVFLSQFQFLHYIWDTLQLLSSSYFVHTAYAENFIVWCLAIVCGKCSLTSYISLANAKMLDNIHLSFQVKLEALNFNIFMSYTIFTPCPPIE